MTTIAYRDGVLAVDTAITSDNGVCRGRVSKLRRTPSGLLFAICGQAGLSDVFSRWLEDGADPLQRPTLNDKSDFAALVVFSDSRVAAFSERFVAQFLIADFHAMGSGNELALGAMAMGASAEEAVRVACRFDVWSREPVETMALRIYV